MRARLRLSYAGVRFDCSGRRSAESLVVTKQRIRVTLLQWVVGKVVFDETTQNRIRVGRAIWVPTLLVDLIN